MRRSGGAARLTLAFPCSHTGPDPQRVTLAQPLAVAFSVGSYGVAVTESFAFTLAQPHAVAFARRHAEPRRRSLTQPAPPQQQAPPPQPSPLDVLIAALLLTSPALAAFMMRRRERYVPGMTGTRLAQMAAVLRQFQQQAAEGNPPDPQQVQQKLDEVLTAPSPAANAGQTEVSAAIGEAAHEVYRADPDVDYAEWLTADDERVCPACMANEAAGPVAIGHPFPSGHLAPPGHPRCRCALTPSDYHAVPAYQAQQENATERWWGWPDVSLDEERRLQNKATYKVGPKGYIHGWIYVGSPVNVMGRHVQHPEHGAGKIVDTHSPVDEHGVVNGEQTVDVQYKDGTRETYGFRERAEPGEGTVELQPGLHKRPAEPPRLSPEIEMSQDPWSNQLTTGQLSGGELGVLRYYVSPEGNEKMNGALRRGGTLPAGTDDEVADLDGVISRFTLKQPWTGYRGIALTPHLASVMKPGAVFTDKGFVSSTTSSDWAQKFAQLRATGHAEGLPVVPSHGGEPVTLRIHVPAGSHMLPGEPDIGEFILPRGTSFHVDSVQPGLIDLSVTGGTADPFSPQAIAARRAAQQYKAARNRATAAARMAWAEDELDFGTAGKGWGDTWEHELRDPHSGEWVSELPVSEAGLRTLGRTLVNRHAETGDTMPRPGMEELFSRWDRADYTARQAAERQGAGWYRQLSQIIQGGASASQAPPHDPLVRGVNLAKPVKPGDRISVPISDWTQDPAFAAGFGGTVLHLPTGEPAVDAHALAEDTGGDRWLAGGGQYQVSRVEGNDVYLERGAEKGWRDAWLHEARNPHSGQWMGIDTFVPDLKPATGVKDLQSAGRRDGTGTADDPIDVQGDLDKAVTLLAEGKHVRLNQPDEVAILAQKVDQIATSWDKGNGPLPNIDFGKVTVKGTNLFTAQTRGIPRIKMPQLAGPAQPGTKAADLVGAGKWADLAPQLKAELAARGITIKEEAVKATHLRATQTDLNGASVAGIAEKYLAGDPGVRKMMTEPLFVTRDNYVLDGHHRWAAGMVIDSADGVLGDAEPIAVHRINMDIGAMVPYANDFAQRWGIAAVSSATSQATVVKGWEDYDADAQPLEEYGKNGAGLIKHFDPRELRNLHGEWAKNPARLTTDQDWAPYKAELLRLARHEKQTRPVLGHTEDRVLRRMAQIQGWDAKPSVGELDPAREKLYRGFGDRMDTSNGLQLADQYVHGEYFGSQGQHGNGAYFTPRRERAASYGYVIEAQLHPAARMGDSDELYEETEKLDPQWREIIGDDAGKMAVMRGYDAFKPGYGGSSRIVVNRGALRVSPNITKNGAGAGDYPVEYGRMDGWCPRCDCDGKHGEPEESVGLDDDTAKSFAAELTRCVSCGCGEPHDTHGDPRNITQEDVEAAGAAARLPGGQAASNIADAFREMPDADDAPHAKMLTADEIAAIDDTMERVYKKRGGNAQTLRDYWTGHGHGGPTHHAFEHAIAWGTPGDFDRCVAMVTEHAKMSPEHAKGYCNRRHFDALGYYPATHARMEREGKKSDMSPLVGADVADGGVMHPEELAKGFCRDARLPGGADVNNVGLGQLGLPVPGTGGDGLSPLDVHVGDVIAGSAEEKVLGANARGVVAPVQNPETVRDGAVGKLPGNPVRTLKDYFAGHLGDEHVSIAAPGGGGGPDPAVTGLVHLGPEPDRERHYGTSHSDSVAAQHAEMERGKKRVTIAELFKVGKEGYIHGWICVRPPCGKDQSLHLEESGRRVSIDETSRLEPTYNIVHGGTGEQLGAVRPGASFSQDGGVRWSAYATNAYTPTETAGNPEDTLHRVAQDRNLTLLRNKANEAGFRQVEIHLANARMSLVDRNDQNVADYLKSAQEELDSIRPELDPRGFSNSKDVAVLRRGVADMYHDFTGNELPGRVLVTPDAPWAKAGKIRRSQLEVRWDGNEQIEGPVEHMVPHHAVVIHKPTGVQVGTIDQEWISKSNPQQKIPWATDTKAYYTGRHADGSVVSYAASDAKNSGAEKALTRLIDAHNKRMEPAPPREPEPPVPAPLPKAPDWFDPDNSIAPLENVDPDKVYAATQELRAHLRDQARYIPNIVARAKVYVRNPRLKNADAEHYGGTGQINVKPSVLDSIGDPSRNQQTLRGTISQGWWTPAGPDKKLLDSVLAHELGHGVADRGLKARYGVVSGRSAAGGNTGRQAAAAMGADMWKAIADGAGLMPPLDLDKKDPYDFEKTINRWIGSNKAKLAREVSTYGTTNMSEMLAELWQEYTQSSDPRAAAKAYGDYVMRYLADRTKNPDE